MGTINGKCILILSLSVLLLLSTSISVPYVYGANIGSSPTPTGDFKAIEITDNKTVMLEIGEFSSDEEYSHCQITISDPLSWIFKGFFEDLGWKNNSYTFSSFRPNILVETTDLDGNRLLSPGDTIVINAIGEYLVKGNWTLALIDIPTGGTMIETTFQIINDYPDPYGPPPSPISFPFGLLIFVLSIVFMIAFIYTVISTEKRKK